MSEELKKRYYELVMIQWNLIKRHLEGDNKTDEYWEAFIEDVNKTVKEIEDQADKEYIKDCLLALMEHFVRRFKDGKHNKTDEMRHEA